MKQGDKFKAQGKNPPQGGSYVYNPDEDEFECVSTPGGEDVASDQQSGTNSLSVQSESSVAAESKTPKAPNSKR